MNKYYINESDWEKISTFLKTISGIRVENEKKGFLQKASIL